MEATRRLSDAPRTLMLLWMGAVAPVAVGLARGGVAFALGAAFVLACPALVLVSAAWPRRGPSLFPLYFAALFVLALATLPFNSAAFVVDTWSALLLMLLVSRDLGRRHV